MDRRTFLGLTAAGCASVSGCISFDSDENSGGGGGDDGDSGGDGGGTLSLGESKTGEGLRVSVTDALVAESIDTNSNNSPSVDAWSLLYELEVEHVGENERAFPHPAGTAPGSVLAGYNEEQISHVLTYRDFTVNGETYANYNRVFQDEGADSAYNGTSISGYALFEIPPDPDLQSAVAQIHWGPDSEVVATWGLG